MIGRRLLMAVVAPNHKKSAAILASHHRLLTLPQQQQQLDVTGRFSAAGAAAAAAAAAAGGTIRNFSRVSLAIHRFGGSSSVANNLHRNNSLLAVRSFASLTDTEIKKRLDEFQDLFVEARLCIEDVAESEGTKYFDEDAEAAQEAVDEAVKAFEQLVEDIEDPNEKNRVLRGNGLKVEQLKGELDLALKGGHDH